jgi:hypothetical protein
VSTNRKPLAGIRKLIGQADGAAVRQGTGLLYLRQKTVVR